MTAAELRSRTVKDLAAMAKQKKVPGWHAMRKDELITALLHEVSGNGGQGCNGSARTTGKRPSKSRKASVTPQTSAKQRSAKPPCGSSHNRARKRLGQIKAQLAQSRDLALKSAQPEDEEAKDRLILFVRDPFWLQAYWELSRATVDRARAALGHDWHLARPVLRLSEVPRNGTTSSARLFVRDIEIHGGVTNWYIDVYDPPKGFQVEIGYRAGERFYALARSNRVTTPRADSGEAFDRNWADVARNVDRIYAMSVGFNEQDTNRELKEVFEQRLRRPLGNPMSTQFGAGAGGQHRAFSFEVGTELIIHGVTDPDAHVTLKGEPVHLRDDGSFAVCFTLPDRRQVLPVVASSGDGVEQRTIVVSVDRNTKVMEPIYRDPGE